jgi:molybdopterin-binding protein
MRGGSARPYGRPLAADPRRLDAPVHPPAAVRQVTAVTPGSVVATVEVDVGGQQMTASITEEAVEDLGLSVGSAVVVLVESTEVVLAVGD